MLGVSVQKPADWVYISSAERTTAITATTDDHVAFTKFVLAHMSKPFVIIVKPRELPPAPTVTALIAPLNDGMSTNPVENLQQMTASGPRMYHNYHVIEKPRAVEIGGVGGAYCKASYWGMLKNGEIIPVSFETFHVVRGNYYFLIGIVSRQPEDESTTNEIRQIISSWIIGKAAVD